jgi:hypothetical protein
MKTKRRKKSTNVSNEEEVSKKEKMTTKSEKNEKIQIKCKI